MKVALAIKLKKPSTILRLSFKVYQRLSVTFYGYYGTFEKVDELLKVPRSII